MWQGLSLPFFLQAWLGIFEDLVQTTQYIWLSRPLQDCHTSRTVSLYYRQQWSFQRPSIGRKGETGMSVMCCIMIRTLFSHRFFFFVRSIWRFCNDWGSVSGAGVLSLVSRPWSETRRNLGFKHRLMSTGWHETLITSRICFRFPCVSCAGCRGSLRDATSNGDVNPHVITHHEETSLRLIKNSGLVGSVMVVTRLPA